MLAKVATSGKTLYKIFDKLHKTKQKSLKEVIKIYWRVMGQTYGTIKQQ